MKPKEAIEFLKAKIRQLVTRKKMEELRDRAKQFASKENIGNMAAKAKELASRENVENVVSKAKELASKESLNELKQGISGLRTAEGRSAAVHRFTSLSPRGKVLIVCLLLVIAYASVKCVTFICGSFFGSAERVSINGVSVDLRNLSNDCLDEAFLDSTEVPVGTIFDHRSSPSLRIMNVVESGVLVHYVKGRKTVPFLNFDADKEVDRMNKMLGLGDYDKIIHIMTDPTKYTDGNELKAGIYVRTGSYKYKSRMGLRKVESYLDVSSEEMEKKISEYRRRIAEAKAEKLMSSEGKALDVDLDIKSICGFVMGGTPSQNWHLFEKSKHMKYYHKKGYQQHQQSGALINPFRQFKEAEATYTFYEGVSEHLYEVELKTEHLDFRRTNEELENVKLLLEKKFKIKMVPDPHPRLSSAYAYMWEGNKGEKLTIQEHGTRLFLRLSSNVVKSRDEFEAWEKKEKEESSKIMPADQGIEAL